LTFGSSFFFSLFSKEIISKPKKGWRPYLARHFYHLVDCHYRSCLLRFNQQPKTKSRQKRKKKNTSPTFCFFLIDFDLLAAHTWAPSKIAKRQLRPTVYVACCWVLRENARVFFPFPFKRKK
jgi:hypothetical protein